MGSRMEEMFEELEAKGDAALQIPGQTDPPSRI